MTEQGYPPRQPGRSGRSRAPHEPRRTGWQVLDAFDDRTAADPELPPWAVPGGIEPIRPVRRREAATEPPEDPVPAPTDQNEPARRGRGPGRSRAALARRRRSKRRMVTWAGGAAVVAVIVVGVLILSQSPAPKSHWYSGWQKGELSTVPDACKVVSTGALQKYLGGTPSHFQPFDDPAQSQCTYTVDKKPNFKVMNVAVQAYRWSLVVGGNGSATANAASSFAGTRRFLVSPPKHTPEPVAKISPVSGLGTEAISAQQVFRVSGGAVTDRVTILARYRNVIINVYLQAQANGGFGPVSVPSLQAGALAVARVVLADVKAETPAA